MIMLIKNANIATMDDENPKADAAVVTDGFFAYVGTRADAEKFISERGRRKEAEVPDCGGAFMMSGFNDSHLHYLHDVKAKGNAADLTGCKSVSEIISRMKTRLERSYDKRSGFWLSGEGWNQDYFTDEKRFPDSKNLDAVTTEYPVIVKDMGVESLPPVIASFGAFPSFRLDGLSTRLRLKTKIVQNLPMTDAKQFIRSFLRYYITKQSMILLNFRLL